MRRFPAGCYELKTRAVVGLSVQDADAGDTKTMPEKLVVAAVRVDALQPTGTGITEHGG